MELMCIVTRGGNIVKETVVDGKSFYDNTDKENYITPKSKLIATSVSTSNFIISKVNNELVLRCSNFYHGGNGVEVGKLLVASIVFNENKKGEGKALFKLDNGITLYMKLNDCDVLAKEEVFKEVKHIVLLTRGFETKINFFDYNKINYVTVEEVSAKLDTLDDLKFRSEEELVIADNESDNNFRGENDTLEGEYPLATIELEDDEEHDRMYIYKMGDEDFKLVFANEDGYEIVNENAPLDFFILHMSSRYQEVIIQYNFGDKVITKEIRYIKAFFEEKIFDHFYSRVLADGDDYSVVYIRWLNTDNPYIIEKEVSDRVSDSFLEKLSLIITRNLDE